MEKISAFLKKNGKWENVLSILVILLALGFLWKEVTWNINSVMDGIDQRHQLTLQLEGSYNLIVDELESYTIVFMQDDTAFITGSGGITRRVDVEIVPSGNKDLPTIDQIELSMNGDIEMTLYIETQQHSEVSRLMNTELMGTLTTSQGTTHNAILVR